MTNPDLPRMVAFYQRQVLVIFIVHMVIGYSLYFVALTPIEPPVWATGYIEQLKPTLGALETAARLSDRPFPAQVMILYTVISSVLLTMYLGCTTCFVKVLRQETYRLCCERWQQTGFPVKERLGFAALAVVGLYAFGYELPIHSFVEGGLMLQGRYVGWLNPALFSSSILSTTMLLLISGITALAIVLVLFSLYLSIGSFKSSTPMRS